VSFEISAVAFGSCVFNAVHITFVWCSLRICKLHCSNLCIILDEITAMS
jgi:hypothetical protein